MFAEDDVTPFEEIVSNVQSYDTYKLAAAGRFYALEDMLETLRQNATSDIYVDDKDEINDRYAEAISTLIGMQNSLTALAQEMTTTYRIRQSA